MDDAGLAWIGRTAFDRRMDDIAGAQSPRDVEYLREEVRRELVGHPRFQELERILDAQHQLLTTRRAGATKPGA
jgi:hypothetical protein